MLVSDHLPPFSLEAEMGVLGCILLSASECLDDCKAAFTAGADVFYDMRHRTLYNALLAMQADSIPIDTISIQKKLADTDQLNGIGGMAFITTLPDSVPSAANIGYYIEIVLDKFHLRKLLQVCVATEKKVFSDCNVSVLLAETENSIGQIDVSQSHDTLDGRETAKQFINDMQRRYDLQGALSGLGTGWQKFDQMTDGLQYGEQTIIAARPSVGKSASAINIVERICLIEGIPTAFVTLEMSPAALAKRLFSSHYRIDMQKLRNGKLDQGEFANMATFSRILAESKLFIIDGVSGMNAALLCALVKRLWRKHGIKLVVIDYLQKIQPPSRHEKRTYEVAAVSGMLKALAVELNVAMLTLAQLSRESEKDKGRLPRLSDLADSSQIERDADCVSLLHRARDKPEQASLIVAKQRDGEVGIINLFFNGKLCRFENVTYQNEPDGRTTTETHRSHP
jgi:replicative DNA helicase